MNNGKTNKLPTMKAPRSDRTGRIAIVRSVSMQPDDWDYVHRRVNELQPRIKDRSHYFQLFVAAERDGRFDILSTLSSRSEVQALASQVATEIMRQKRTGRP